MAGETLRSGSVIVLALFYVGVPVHQAVLLGTILVFQAILGSWILTVLLKNLTVSILTAIGPGLLIGGAVSFAVFQLSGRGTYGSLATILVNLTSYCLLARSRRWSSTPRSTWWVMGQIVGVATLSLTHQYPILLPIALPLLALGLLPEGSKFAKHMTPILLIALASIAVASSSFRPISWWFASDDYKFFVVLSRHITKSGVLADWGVSNNSVYHWLSYGWAGLLDHLSVGSEPFLILGHVMPFVYSISLAASLMMLATLLHGYQISHRVLLSVWAIVAVNQIDWSGTSNGGVYAALAAFALLGMATKAKRQLSISQVIVLGSIALIGLLTKFPSVYAFVLMATFALVPQPLRRAKTSSSRRWLLLVAASLTIISLFALLFISSTFFGDTFRIVSINPAHGQISWFGKSFAAPALVIQQFWLWILVACLACLTWQMRLSFPASGHWLVVTLSIALLMGLAFDLIIEANADNHRYFSGPMYFYSSLALLFVAARSCPSASSCTNLRQLNGPSLLLLAGGMIWGVRQFRDSFWSILANVVPTAGSLGIELLKFVSSDSRFGVSLVAAGLVTNSFLRQRRTEILVPLALTLLVFSLINHVPKSVEAYKREVSTEMIEGYTGSEASKEVGRWLGDNSPESALIATNRLVTKNGVEISDYSLAVWSDREFLLLGPRFASESSSKTDALRLSIAFADAPNNLVCSRLSKAGVQWFIVDLRLTDNRDWSICSTEKFQSGAFVVLKIQKSIGL